MGCGWGSRENVGGGGAGGTLYLNVQRLTVTADPSNVGARAAPSCEMGTGLGRVLLSSDAMLVGTTEPSPMRMPLDLYGGG